jgi:trimethylamine--corrinoid protein Co-methyltransferase
MGLKGHTVSKPINILSDEQVERIHYATLDVLERTGVRFENDKALEILEGAGCKVDHEKKIVRFPPGLVEDCLRKTPSSFTLRARESKNDLRFGGNTLYFAPFAAQNKGDPDTGARARPTLKEAAEAYRLMDALDNIHFPFGGSWFDVEGVEPLMQFPTRTATCIRNSSKGIAGVSYFDCEIWDIKLAEATNQDVLGGVTSSPPLTWDGAVINATFRYLEKGFPIGLSGGQNFGATSPVTIAGSLVTNNAELISMIALIQLVKPGRGTLAGNYAQPLSMRSGLPLLGAIEKSIHGMAFAQLWRHYKIPSATVGSTDAKLADYQCGYEKAISVILLSLAGFNSVWHGGGLYDELTWSPVVMLMDNDIFGMTARVLRGIEVNDETLAVDVIDEVGPIPGHFLNRAHTRKWWKTEIFEPMLADRQPHPEWVESGSKNIVQRAKAKMAEILAKYEPTPLTKEQEKAVAEVLKEAESYYGQLGMM